MNARPLPLIILLILSCMGLGIIIAQHGKPRKEKYNAWTALLAMIIEWGLILWAIL